ncbi:MAG: AsmA family protein [Deltaproteobacteria bacterium]
MKKIFIIIAIIVVVLIVLGIARDQIIKSAITIVATQITGAPVHIGGLSLGILSQSVRMSDFKMYNPKGFSNAVLVDIKTIKVSLDLGALLKKKIHLTDAEFDLREMNLEKNKEGKLNVDSLKVAKEEQAGKPGAQGKQMPLQIDLLKLDIGKLVSRDYTSAGVEPSLKVYDINIHKTYRNITSSQQLAALILAEPMKAAGIQGAKIYAVSMLAGAAILPVAVAATFAGKDSVQQDFSSGFDRIYEVSLGVLKQMGKITKEDRAAGTIGASIDSATVALKIKKKENNNYTVTISARKYLLPKPEIAGGVMYNISEKLK